MTEQWFPLDSNPLTVAIDAATNSLYQLHKGGAIYRFTGVAGTGWEQLDGDNGAVAITSARKKEHLWQLRSDGTIHRRTVIELTWELIDDDSGGTTAILGSGIDTLYKLRDDGHIFVYAGSAGWIELDDNPATRKIVAAEDQLYQLRAGGSVWQYTGTPDTGWVAVSADTRTVDIVAAQGLPPGSSGGARDLLYLLRDDGSVRQFTGAGWPEFDNNPATTAIAAFEGDLLQRHDNGDVWSYTGTPLTGWLKQTTVGRDSTLVIGAPQDISGIVSHIASGIYVLQPNGAIFEWIETIG